MNRHFLPIAMLAGCAGLVACNNAEQRADNAAASLETRADAAGDRIENAADRAGERIDLTAREAGQSLEGAADRAVAALTPTPRPQEFVDRAARSDAFELASARLALTKAASPEVKAFAQQMIKAHTESTAKIKAAAAKANPPITVNATMTSEENKELAELGRLTGAKFDDEYMDEQVDAHEDALALMKAFASDGADPGLKAVAGELAPIVAEHLRMARELEKKTDI